MLSTRACAALATDCAESNSARETTRSRNKRDTRLRLLSASSRSDSAAESSAVSVDRGCCHNRGRELLCLASSDQICDLQELQTCEHREHEQQPEYGQTNTLYHVDSVRVSEALGSHQGLH